MIVNKGGRTTPNPRKTARRNGWCPFGAGRFFAISGDSFISRVFRQAPEAPTLLASKIGNFFTKCSDQRERANTRRNGSSDLVGGPAALCFILPFRPV